MSFMHWTVKPGTDIENELGLIPGFLDPEDERSAAKQFAAKYQGGWRNSMAKAKLSPTTKALLYPGDPPLHPIATTMLRDERIIVYPHGFVVIEQRDGSFEGCRMD